MEAHLTERLCEAVAERLGVECILLPERELPPTGYHVIRGQYSGDVLLRELSRMGVDTGAKHLGIVDVDMYARGLNFIFGIAQVGGDFALISLYRLGYIPPGLSTAERNRLMFERALKEAVHELGHTLGMTHCSNKRCVMSFSNSLEEVDAKSADFCEEHRTQLARILKRL